jgi:hypothetical protein
MIPRSCGCSWVSCESTFLPQARQIKKRRARYTAILSGNAHALFFNLSWIRLCKIHALRPYEQTANILSFRRFIGVTDIASVRFSLPAQLLEPTPNLEYWNYLDQPNTFVAIGDSDDALDRMLEVLRFWFTKDLKYVKGKPCKPYNSTLGEFFRVRGH